MTFDARLGDMQYNTRPMSINYIICRSNNNNDSGNVNIASGKSVSDGDMKNPHQQDQILINSKVIMLLLPRFFVFVFLVVYQWCLLACGQLILWFNTEYGVIIAFIFVRSTTFQLKYNLKHTV